MSTAPSTASAAHWIALLILLGFGIAFTAGGAVMLKRVGWNQLWTHYQSRHWTPVPAEIQSVSVKRMRCGTGGRNLSSYPCIELQARYRYSQGDHHFEGSRATLRDRRKDGDPTLEALHDRLGASLRDQRKVTAWIDPSHPEQALLDRSLPTESLAVGLILGLLFTPVGVLLLIGAWRSYRAGPEGH